MNKLLPFPGKKVKTHDTVAKIKACDEIRLIGCFFVFLHYLITITSPTGVKGSVISASNSMVVKRHSSFMYRSWMNLSFSFRGLISEVVDRSSSPEAHDAHCHLLSVYSNCGPLCIFSKSHKIVFLLHALNFALWVYCALLCQVCGFIHKLQVETELAIFPL